MPKTTSSTKENPQIFSLKVNKAKPLTAPKKESGNGTLETMQRSVAAPKDLSRQYKASVDIFEKSGLPITGKTLADGNHFASVALATTGYTFDQLFTNFVSDLTKQFVFDDAIVQLFQKPGERVANFVTFTGKMRMDSPLLAPFKNFLKLQDGLVLTSLIPNGGLDLASKILPSDITLTSPDHLYLKITDDIILSEGSMKVTISRKLDVVSNQTTWEYAPKVSGVLTIHKLAFSPIILDADIAYDDGVLSVNASIDRVTGLFGVADLNLQDFNVAFVAGTTTDLNVSATLNAGISVFDFQGKITSKNSSMLAIAENFTSDDLNDLFRTMTGGRLAMPDFDVVFKNVVIGLSNGKTTIDDYKLEEGLTVNCSLNIHGHECSATALISPDGISFVGELGAIKIGPVEISGVRMKMEIYSAASGKTSQFALYGSAVIQGITVDCKVAYEKSGASWTAVVYGMLSASSFGMSTIFPASKGTLLDSFKFSKVAFIFASQDGTAKDPDFPFTVKQGLQLTGTLEEFEPLTQLTRSKKVGLQLTALFGPATSITIALPETRLELGPSVTADPFYISIQIAPQPELGLIFGLNVTVPGQATPLHFDLKLAMGLIGANASGTMKGYWENPFGVRGLKVGPDLALQFGITYATFFASGIVTGFGFAGGIVLGDVVAKMAVSIADDPTKEILLGEVAQLSPQNLVKFASTITGLKLAPAAVPDFFNLKQLKLYCAPTGGMIGTISYQQGFSFIADLVLFNKEISIYTSFTADGVFAKGELDKLDIGPLKIKGQQGKRAKLDLELSMPRQAVLIDGAIDFMGSLVGLNTSISKQGIEFKFNLKFEELLTFNVTGKSEGVITNPAAIDFLLSAEFDAALTAYLKNNLCQRIKETMNAANSTIDVLQKDLKKKEDAYKALYKPVDDALKKAQSDADKALNLANKKVEDEMAKWTTAVAAAQKNLSAAEAAYNKLLGDTTKAVKDAEAKYNAAFKGADDALKKAQKDYDSALTAAQNKVNTAKKAYDDAFGGAQGALNKAQKDVNSIKKKIDSLNKELRNLEGWDRIKAPVLSAQIAALKVSKAAATTVLNAAKAAVNAFKNTTAAIAFNAATAALNVVKTTGQFAVLQAAQNALRTVQRGGDFIAFENAKQALATIESSTKYVVWNNAKETLQTVTTTGRTVLTQAEHALLNIGSSVVYAALEIAKKNVEFVKNGSAAMAFRQAQAYLQALENGAEALSKLSAFVATHSGDIIEVRKVKLSGRLKDIEKGKLLKSEIDVLILGKPFKWDLEFDAQDVAGFIQAIFSKALEEAKKFALGR